MMINTRQQLKYCLETERKFYAPSSHTLGYLKRILVNDSGIMRWKYVKTLRTLEFYFNNRNRGIHYAILNGIYARKFHRLQFKLGIEMDRNIFDEGLMIYHTQGIVVNGDARVGKNCMLHGGNVIGNMGNDLSTPVLGDNVRLGTGAKVLGDVYIADGVQIGAGAVVLDSCYEKGALLVGIPAKVHKKGNNE